MAADIKVYRQRTNLQTILAAAIVFALGILLLVGSRELTDHPVLQFLAGNLGSLCVASIVLSLIWELTAKRSFLAEILAHSGLARQIDQSGVLGLPIKWNQDIPWPRLLRETSHVDVFVAYGNNWRGAHGDEWKRFAQRKGTSCRVILPDPDDEAVVAALACQFKRNPELIRSRIREATREFSEAFSSPGGREPRCKIYYNSRPPLFFFFYLWRYGRRDYVQA